MAAQHLFQAHRRIAARTEPSRPDRILPHEDLFELLREGGMPHAYTLEWLIDRVEFVPDAPR